VCGGEVGVRAIRSRCLCVQHRFLRMLLLGVVETKADVASGVLFGGARI
jgi:hypothetical protein